MEMLDRDEATRERIRQRNIKNARRQRPSRQKITGAELLALMHDVSSLPSHKQCPEALRRWVAKGNSMSITAFRKRWKAIKGDS